MGNEKLRQQWNELVTMFSNKFADGDQIDLDGILFLIGIQEVGKGHKYYKKDEKLDVMHVAICTLLQPYGYYEFTGLDADGWPHFIEKEKLPNLKAGEQTVLMKEAVVYYAIERGWIQ
jgi:hypothetical protein